MTTTKKISKADFLASKPAWAVSAIVAEFEADKSDSMTDYFATSTERIVFLGWSKHNRDLFSEMRKHAATFSETAHLGPGKDLYTARVVTSVDVVSGGSAHWKGSYSPWHRDLYPDGDAPTFETLAEAEAFIAKAGAPHDISFEGKIGTFEWKIEKRSVEHREKYSMGAGYYLKGSGRYSTGWTVSKTSPNSWMFGDTVEVAVPDKPAKSVAAPKSLAEANATGTSVALNAAKNGVEIRFPAKPDPAVLTALKANGWRWSRFGGLWYHRDTPDARAFAYALVGVAA